MIGDYQDNKPEDDYKKYGYSKKSIWKWILIYAVVGVIVYGIIYYFIF